jgi:uncharacterized repeat protein (TIGR03843 family)
MNKPQSQFKKFSQTATYELKGQFMLGSNYTFLVDVTHEDKTYSAVYKPSKGEQPLWDFPEQHARPTRSGRVSLSECLGFHIVPFTTLRDDGPYGAGSIQQYIEYDPEYHYFNFSSEDKQALKPVVLFDLLVNNADRKGGHVFFENETHKLFTPLITASVFTKTINFALCYGISAGKKFRMTYSPASLCPLQPASPT